MITILAQWFMHVWNKALPVAQSIWGYMLIVAIMTCLVVYGLDRKHK